MARNPRLMPRPIDSRIIAFGEVLRGDIREIAFGLRLAGGKLTGALNVGGIFQAGLFQFLDLLDLSPVARRQVIERLVKSLNRELNRTGPNQGSADK